MFNALKKIFKKSLLIALISPLLLSSCQHINPDASMDGVIGTVGGAFGNINQPQAPAAQP